MTTPILLARSLSRFFDRLVTAQPALDALIANTLNTPLTRADMEAMLAESRARYAAKR